MQAKTMFRGAVVLMLAMASVAHADQFLAKPGAWEVTGTARFEPNDRNEARRQKMTPEQRAQEDKKIAGLSQPHTGKLCFTKKELELDEMARVGNVTIECTAKNLSKSPTRVVTEKSCPGYTETYTIEATSPDSMKIQIASAYSDRGTVRVEMQARWAGESCADVPPQK